VLNLDIFPDSCSDGFIVPPLETRQY